MEKLQKLKEVIDTASKTGRKILVKGYRSSSGRVSDAIIELVDPSEGYAKLVRESLTKLPSASGGEFPPELVQKASEELAASFHKTLTREVVGEGPRTSITYEAPEGARWKLKNGDNNSVAVFHVLMHFSREKEAAVSKVNSRPLTKAKEHLKKQLPIGNYVGQLLFEPDKFEGVSLIG